MVMQKLGLCRVGYSSRTTDKGSCFNPRWALGLLYKDVSFMFIQDQSGSFWAACDPFSNQALAKSIHLLKQLIMKDMKAHVFGITLVHSFLILSLEPTKRIKMT